MSSRFRTVFLIGGLVLAGAMYALTRGPLQLDPDAAFTAAVTMLCAAWWCTEALPIPVTSLIPFAVFPLAGVLDYGQLGAAYGDKFVLLFMAGFMLSRAAEHSRAHLRVSHAIMNLMGTGSQKRLVLGFLLAPAFCSMWISNTATALIMLPVAIAVLQEQDDERLAVPLLLAVAYGCSIGGIATIIGTPPNGVMISVYEQQTGLNIDFFTWFKLGAPICIAMLVAAGLLLTRGLGAGREHDLEDLGPWTPAQRRVLAVLGLTALLWITRSAPAGGWSGWLGTPMAHDATVGLCAVLALFLIPSGARDERGQPAQLLDWQTAQQIPWGVLILFGGGIAIAKAFQVTGLAQNIGEALAGMKGLHPALMIGLICLVLTFLTEVTSNTATTTLMMPILFAAAQGMQVEPALFMAPAALSASCAFMLPVATPPNAIVFASGKITIPGMARKGVVLNLVGVAVITTVCYLVIDRQTGLGITPTPESPAAARVIE